MPRWIVALLLALAGLTVIGWEFVRHFEQIRAHAYRPGWGALLSIPCVMLAQWLAGSATWLALRGFVPGVSWRAVLRIHLLAQAAKYLPLGGLVNLGAQGAGLLALPGIQLTHTGLALLTSQLALCAAAASWYGLSSLAAGGLAPAASAALALTLPLLLLLLVWSRPARLLGRILPARLLPDRLVAPLAGWTGLADGRFVLWLGLLSLAAAGGLGLSLAAVVADVVPGTARAVLQLVGVMSLAWLLGFLSLVVPAGLGVRDGLLVLLLAGLLPAPWHVVLPIVSRLGWVLADAGNYLVALLCLGGRRGTAQPADENRPTLRAEQGDA